MYAKGLHDVHGYLITWPSSSLLSTRVSTLSKLLISCPLFQWLFRWFEYESEESWATRHEPDSSEPRLILPSAATDDPPVETG